MQDVIKADELEIPNHLPKYLSSKATKPVFLLFTPDKVTLPENELLADNEGIVDFMQMRRWQPTIAYAAEAAYLLRRMCRPESGLNATNTAVKLMRMIFILIDD